MRSCWRRLAKNSSNIVALCSLGIAILSLLYAVQAQRDDFEYRELSIRPQLLTDSDPLKFTLTIKNVGTGAAQLTRLVEQLGNKCVNSQVSTADGWDKIIDEADQQIAAYIAKAFTPMTDRKLTPPNASIVDFPKIGTFVEPNKEYLLFESDPTEIKAAIEAMNSTDKSIRYAVQGMFSNIAVIIPFAYKYCSLSGQFCAVAGPTDFKSDQCLQAIAG